MKAVIFLGAGFSEPFGHPMMNSFLPHADASGKVTDDDRDFLGRLILEARRANSFLESSPTNLEDILSFAVMGERLNLPGSENYPHRIKEIIRKIYTDPGQVKGYWDRYKPLNHFFGLKFKDLKKELTFVTTNYDLNIESACCMLNLYANPGFRIDRVEPGEVRVHGRMYDDSGIPLYKLHGSVNWYPSNTDVGIVVEDRTVLITDGGSLPYPCISDYKSPDTPVIVPPTFLKPDLQEALKTIWRTAAKAICEANVILFVGYSFPQSDTEMMYFLARALMDNTHLRDVYIVNPDADAIIQMLQGANSKMGSHFKRLLRPVPRKWTQVYDLTDKNPFP